VKIIFGVLLLVYHFIASIRPILAAESKAAWQTKWERTMQAAETEGQLVVYIGGYGAIIDAGVTRAASMLPMIIYRPTSNGATR